MAEPEADRGPDAVHRLLGLLGLPGSASVREIDAAWRRLRAHVSGRLASAADPAARRARRDELDRLDAARHAALGPVDGGAGARDDRTGDRRGPTRGAMALALVAAVLVGALLGAVLATLLLRRPEIGPTRDVATAAATLVVAADPPSATLTVTTGDDARVLVSVPADGTPQTLPPGAHALAVVHPDCPDDWTQAVTLAAGESRRYAPKICVGAGSLVVRSNVAEDRLTIDGVDVGATGTTAHPLRVGTHRVRVEKAGHEPWTAEVRVADGQELVLNAELASSGPASPAAASPPAAPPPKPPPAAGPPPTDGPADRAAGMVREDAGGAPIPPRTGKGGSKSWHDAVMHDLVRRHDRNGSGSLDTTEEVQSITCETWRSIEESYETGGLAVEMTHLYGFDGSDAPANTLGITRAVRGYAYDRMKACGLKARR